MDTINIFSVIVMAIATVILAIFTWRTWRISNEQHKLYHDPDLAIFSLEPGKYEQFDKDKQYEKNDKLTYSALLVNHGRIPIVVTDVWEKIADDIDNQDIQSLFRPPSGTSTEGRKLLLELPTVIPSGDFLICTRECGYKEFYERLSEVSQKKLLNSLLVKAEYYTTEDKPKIEGKRILLYVHRHHYPRTRKTVEF